MEDEEEEEEDIFPPVEDLRDTLLDEMLVLGNVALLLLLILPLLLEFVTDTLPREDVALIATGSATGLVDDDFVVTADTVPDDDDEDPVAVLEPLLGTDEAVDNAFEVIFRKGMRIMVP